MIWVKVSYDPLTGQYNVAGPAGIVEGPWASPESAAMEAAQVLRAQVEAHWARFRARMARLAKLAPTAGGPAVIEIEHEVLRRGLVEVLDVADAEKVLAKIDALAKGG